MKKNPVNRLNIKHMIERTKPANRHVNCTEEPGESEYTHRIKQRLNLGVSSQLQIRKGSYNVGVDTPSFEQRNGSQSLPQLIAYNQQETDPSFNTGTIDKKAKRRDA